MGKRNMKWQLPLLLFFIVATVLILRRHNVFQTDEGLVFGTVYRITYQCADNLKDEIEAELKKVDASLSPFNPTSVISRINRNEEVQADTFFTTVFRRSEEIAKETDGCFDITVAPLVNAWGFGFKESIFPDSAMIDSLLDIVGHEKVCLQDGRVVKSDSRTMLDCSAIAKGFGCDAVARLFDRKGIQSYMVEIGGEVVVKGRNPKHDLWRIGISKPVEDSLAVNQDLQVVLEITDAGMATSGNYRNFYYKGGKRYAHTIDPKSGYSVQHSLLSATVVASDCMTADAYATAFMVMGLERAKAFAESNPAIDAYFIYEDELGNLKTCFTEGMGKYLVKQ